MSILQAILLGGLQGLTEFLPVSSSGHLVLVQHLLQMDFDPSALQGFDIVLHAGTATAIIWAYRQDWWHMLSRGWKPSPEQKQILLLILATIPAGLAGVFLKDVISAQFRTLPMIGASFCITGFVLLLVGRLQGSQSTPTWRHALVMGLVQALAIIPGVSRSGMTIGGGIASGLTQAKAVDFSFQMALPIILGAFVLTVKEGLEGTVNLPSATLCIVGFITSFVISLLALYTIRAFVHRFKIGWFAVYLLPLGIGLILF